MDLLDLAANREAKMRVPDYPENVCKVSRYTEFRFSMGKVLRFWGGWRNIQDQHTGREILLCVRWLRMLEVIHSGRCLSSPMETVRVGRVCYHISLPYAPSEGSHSSSKYEWKIKKKSDEDEGITYLAYSFDCSSSSIRVRFLETVGCRFRGRNRDRIWWVRKSWWLFDGRIDWSSLVSMEKDYNQRKFRLLFRIVFMVGIFFPRNSNVAVETDFKNSNRKSPTLVSDCPKSHSRRLTAMLLR